MNYIKIQLFHCMCDQNAALVIIGNLFQKHYKNLNLKLLNGRIHIFIHTHEQTVGYTEQF